MPTYEYRCPANGRTFEVAHAMSETLRTWGELRTRAGAAADSTPDSAPVEKVPTTMRIASGAASAPARSCGCGAGGCGRHG